jgi:hypothetical protein
MGQIRSAHKYLLKNLKGRDLLGDKDIDGRILKWIVKKQDTRCGVDSPGSEQGPVVGSE